MSLRVKTHRHKDLFVVAPAGDLSGADVAKLQRRLDEAGKSSESRIAVDLSATTFIDSHGLGMLIFQWKLLQAGGRELILACPGSFVREILANANLPKVVRIIESLDEP